MVAETKIVLRVICRVDGARTEADGRYIVEYDPTLSWHNADRSYKLITTADITKARGFDNLPEASRYIHRVCPNFPTRADGQPNRPITAFTIEITSRTTRPGFRRSL